MNTCDRGMRGKLMAVAWDGRVAFLSMHYKKYFCSIYMWRGLPTVWCSWRAGSGIIQPLIGDCSESTGLLLEDVYRTVRGRTLEPGGPSDVRSRGVPP